MWSHLTHAGAIFHAFSWMYRVSHRERLEIHCVEAGTVEGKKCFCGLFRPKAHKVKTQAPRKVSELTHHPGSMFQVEMGGTFPGENTHINESDYMFPATESEASKRNHTESTRT